MSFRSIVKRIYDSIMVKIPLRDAIVFECESDMDDNPRAFYEYLIENDYHRKYHLIWIVKDTEFCRQKYAHQNVDFVSRLDRGMLNQIKLKYYLSTSKWFVFSHPWWFSKFRQEQVIIHVGHGTPIKQAGKKNSRDCFDYLLVPTENVMDWYTKFWYCDKEKVFTCGLPRNDLLWKGARRKKEILTALIPQYLDERVVMCMPTFRQSQSILDSDIIDCFALGVVDSSEQFEKLNACLREQRIHLIIKPHPLQKMEYIQVTEASNIHYYQNHTFLQKGIMLYELLGCCDALLSDVSSVVFDYLLLNRPIGFFMNNYDTYARGYLLEDPTEYMPGKYIYTFDDLMDFVRDVSQERDNYKAERIRVNEYVNGREFGEPCFSRDLANWIWNGNPS